MIDDTFHISGGGRNFKHFTWNINETKWRTIHDFGTNLIGPTLVHVPSKGILLSIGGFIGGSIGGTWMSPRIRVGVAGIW